MADKIKVTLPDGSVKEYGFGITGKQVAANIGPRLAKAAVAIKVNGELKDISYALDKDCSLKILTFDDPDGKQAFWHTSAHVLAQAVLELWPDALRTIGPPIENGFYFDFYRKEPFTLNDLGAIEKKMMDIAGRKRDLVRKDLLVKEAKAFYKGNKFKLELIDEFTKEGAKTLSFYQQGDYMDLCKGGHADRVDVIGAVKLTKVSSAYWRGDSARESLQRIYGISFPEAKQLKEHVHLQEEAEKRDHRKLGRELGLFMTHEYSPGSPFYLPKGTIVYMTLLNFIREEYKKRGYMEVITPLLYDKELWVTSGHWDHYKNNMFFTESEGKLFSLKSMNCPSHCLIYKNSAHSYRELPLRIADFAPLHRNELSGTLTGLTRVRKFSQDDSHIFCTPEQLTSELQGLREFVKFVYKDTFGMDYHIELSTRPEKYLGDIAVWTKAEETLASTLKKLGMSFKVNPGDGAFYGPKIDIHVKDSLGRTWQCATIQLDFQLPARFELVYEGSDGKQHTPVIIHRAMLGSLERFMGCLIEHYAGKFPLWLNPNQVIILPIADRHAAYAKKAALKMSEAGLRVAVDESAETTNKKIREAQLAQYNYILVVGDAEEKNGTVNVRTRDEKVHGEKKVDVLVKELGLEIGKRK